MASKISPASIQAQIRELGDSLSRAGLLIDQNYTAMYRIGRNCTRLTWRNYGVLTDAEFATLKEYIEFLQNRQYTFLLFDGSLVQISYDIRRGTLVQHRLAFYPSPVYLEPEEWGLYQEGGLGLSDFLDDKLGSEEFPENLRLQSPIRFDFDLEEASEDHPASHLHLSREDCRIPVFAPLSIGYFVRFVFRHFYPEQWEKHEFLRRWPCERLDRTLTDMHRRQLHIECLEG